MFKIIIKDKIGISKYGHKRGYPLYILLYMKIINLAKLNYDYLYYIKVTKKKLNYL